MICDINVVGSQVVVKLNGSIYVDEAADIRHQVIEYINKGYTDFVVYLTGVDYIDSSGLGVLVAIQKRALQKGGGVKIKGLTGIVKELFELTRLTKVFEVE